MNALHRSKRRVFVAVLPLAGAAQLALGGASIVLPVSRDESVNSGFAEKNYADNSNRGGLFVGSDGTGTGVARFYLQFDLPEIIKPSEVETATLWATYEDDLDRNDNGLHRIHYVAADDWREDTINWANQPGPSYGSAEALFDSASAKVGDTVKWDLTQLVQSELNGDDTLSLMFAAANESVERGNRNWEYFAEREFNPSHAFHLTLSTSARIGGGGAVAVPLPPAVWPAAITFAAATVVPVVRRIGRNRSAK